MRKELRVHYGETQTSLRLVVELLSSLGYSPELSTDGRTARDEAAARRSRYYKIGIAGFAFSNIMLLSFPDYLSSGDRDSVLATVFKTLSVALALPVFLYSASDYFRLSFAGHEHASEHSGYNGTQYMESARTTFLGPGKSQ